MDSLWPGSTNIPRKFRFVPELARIDDERKVTLLRRCNERLDKSRQTWWLTLVWVGSTIAIGAFLALLLVRLHPPSEELAFAREEPWVLLGPLLIGLCAYALLNAVVHFAVDQALIRRFRRYLREEMQRETIQEGSKETPQGV